MLDESSDYKDLEVKGFQNAQVEREIKVKQNPKKSQDFLGTSIDLILDSPGSHENRKIFVGGFKQLQGNKEAN